MNIILPSSIFSLVRNCLLPNNSLALENTLSMLADEVGIERILMDTCVRLGKFLDDSTKIVKHQYH